MLVGLCGCLTSPNAFYKSEDIIQNTNIVGSFIDRKEVVTWQVIPSEKEIGRYEITLHDHEAWTLFLATLFRIEDITYVDLIPMKDSSVHFDKSPSGEMPTVSQMAKLVFFERRHAVFRIDITGSEITYWMANPNAVKLIRSANPKLRSHQNGYAVVIDEPTGSLRDFLVNHKQDKSLFTEKIILERIKASKAENRNQSPVTPPENKESSKP